MFKGVIAQPLEIHAAQEGPQPDNQVLHVGASLHLAPAFGAHGFGRGCQYGSDLGDPGRAGFQRAGVCCA